MTASNREVTLEEVLENREQRVTRQRAMLAGIADGSLISFTVNIPGAVKDSPDARVIFAAGLDALVLAAKTAGLAIRERDELLLPTGPEALFQFEAGAVDVKRMAVDLETRHPLGRLFDMDVLDAAGNSVSRTVLGAAPRSCLVCGDAAATCGRSRAHPVPELLDVIHRLVADYLSSEKQAPLHGGEA